MWWPRSIVLYHGFRQWSATSFFRSKKGNLWEKKKNRFLPHTFEFEKQCGTRLHRYTYNSTFFISVHASLAILSSATQIYIPTSLSISITTVTSPCEYSLRMVHGRVIKGPRVERLKIRPRLSAMFCLLVWRGLPHWNPYTFDGARERSLGSLKSKKSLGSFFDCLCNIIYNHNCISIGKR